jgi:hypothetical protein
MSAAGAVANCRLFSYPGAGKRAAGLGIGFAGHAAGNPGSLMKHEAAAGEPGQRGAEAGLRRASLTSPFAAAYAFPDVCGTP